MPKQVVTRELIEETAFKITRRMGIDAVTEENIIERLACTTRMIHKYYPDIKDYYPDIKDLHENVKERTVAFIKDYYKKYIHVPDPDAARRAHWLLTLKESRLEKLFFQIRTERLTKLLEKNG